MTSLSLTKFNWMILIQLLLPLSFSDSFSMLKNFNMIRHGQLSPRPSGTLTIPCFLRPLKNGLSIWCKTCFHVIWTLSIMSITYSWKKLADAILETERRRKFSAVLRGGKTNVSEWPTLPLSALIMLMELPPSILKFLNARFSLIFIKCGLINSSTWQTVWPLEDGSSALILDFLNWYRKLSIMKMIGLLTWEWSKKLSVIQETQNLWASLWLSN